jgi:ABC-type taurine transport system ATPase subunit
VTALITLEQVSREFDGGRVVALSDVNLTIEKGQSVAVVGTSGSGKTTLIMLMCGIMAPSAGTIRWNGKPVTTPSSGTARPATSQEGRQEAVLNSLASNCRCKPACQSK